MWHNSGERKCIEVLTAKRERKRPHVRPRHRKDDDTEVYLKK
jgi:hypothetical protein